MRIIVPTVLLLAASLACAEAIEDPSDLFLRAFGAFQKGEKLVAGNSPEEAAREFKQAGALLKELEDIHPSWNPKIVEFRQKRVAQALEKLPAENSTKAETSSVSSSNDQRSSDATCCDVSASETKCLIKPGETPSNAFLRAFTAYQKGEKLAAGNSSEEAAREFKQADALLKALEEKYPNWNPAIVEFRKKRVAQALEKLPVGDSTKAETPSEPSVPEKGPVIEKPSFQSPSTEQWKQFRFNGQPYHFVPLMVLPNKEIGSN